MKLFARLILGAATLPLISAIPAAAGLNGDYTIKLYYGPSHNHTKTLCITFTNTGTILGFPDSGTWQVQGDPDVGGNFVVDGKTLRWSGTELSGSVADTFYNKIESDIPGKGGYESWDVSAPPITAIADGITTMRAGCR